MARNTPADTPGAAGRPRKSSSKLEITRELIDVPTAQKYLDINEANRNIRSRMVTEFKRDMLAGNWRDVGDAIRFDTEGNLIDGQHRLTALVAAGEEDPSIALEFTVVRNVETVDRAVIDIGSKRTAADQLKMAGYGNPVLLAPAAKWCLLWERQALYADAEVRSVTHQEVMDYVQENPELQDIVATVKGRLKKGIDMPSPYVCTGYYLTHQIDEGAAFQFFERLSDGALLEPGSPILALRSRLRDLKNTHASLAGDMWLSLLLRTWNAWREQRSLRNIPVERSGKPIPAPGALI